MNAVRYYKAKFEAEQEKVERLELIVNNQKTLIARLRNKISLISNAFDLANNFLKLNK